jgi:hypothetical protein
MPSLAKTCFRTARSKPLTERPRLPFPPMARPLSLLVIGLALSACLGSVPGFAQTLADGLDHPATIGPITTKAALLDGANFPSGEWTYTTGTTYDNIDAITSVLPGRSTSQTEMLVQGPATISFWWKMTGASSFDTLQFSSRNDFTFLTGNADWQPRSFQVDTGSQPLNWYFERLANTASGQAWLDQMVVTPIPNNPALQAAVENFSYTFHSTDWTSGSLNGAINSTVAKSGPILPNQKSNMVFEVAGPATVRFRWGIEGDSSDESSLALMVNNQIAASITGPHALAETSVDLGPGTHPMKFSFTRIAASNPEYTGPIEGYLDNLIIDTFSASPALADAIERDAGVYSNSWTRQTQVVRDGSDAATVTAPDERSARRLYAQLPDEAGLLTFWYKMEADPASGYLIMLIDGEQFLSESGVKDWTRVEMNLGTGSERVLQGIFVRYSSPNGSSANTRVYLDGITFTPGATNYQPDLAIGLLTKPLKGIGIHNASGAGQIATIRAPVTRPVGEYTIRIQNGSGTESDTIKLRGIGSRRDFTIFYLREEGGKKLNYSAAFAAGTFETSSLDPKATESHEIWIIRKRNSLKKRSHNYLVIGTSTEDSRKVDAVKTKVLVKSR